MEERVKTLGIICANHFSAQLDAVRLRTGRITERIKIDHPEAAAVIPFLDTETVLMVRQWRYAIGRETLEIPAGKADPGEDPTVCALRELREETGYEAHSLFPIFSYYPAIGYSNEVIRLYAAFDLKRVEEKLDEDEISRVEAVSLKRIEDLILDGKIEDGKTVIGISLFKARKERGQFPPELFFEKRNP
ncbi:MAG: NUDIX hydrolase [Syntrophobacteraceae bacterium]|nr:NUDIX hydrolase [Desulfobacteraceae bacterium]